MHMLYMEKDVLNFLFLPNLQAMFPSAVSIMDLGEEIGTPHMCNL